MVFVKHCSTILYLWYVLLLRYVHLKKKHLQCLRLRFQQFLMTKERFSIQLTFIFTLLLAYQYLATPHWSLRRRNSHYGWFFEQLPLYLVFFCFPLNVAECPAHVYSSLLTFPTSLVVTSQLHSVFRKNRSCFARNWASSKLSSLSFHLGMSLDQVSVSLISICFPLQE